MFDSSDLPSGVSIYNYIYSLSALVLATLPCRCDEMYRVLGSYMVNVGRAFAGSLAWVTTGAGVGPV